MKINRTGVIALVGGLVVLLIIAIAIGLSMYSASTVSRVELLTRYFRALAANDTIGLDELTSPDFSSDLLLPPIKPGSYDLFDFGETEGPIAIVQRFLLIVDSGQDGKAAYLADMEYERKRFGTEIQAIRMINRGVPIKP